MKPCRNSPARSCSPSLFVTVPLHGKWYPYDNEGQYIFDTLCGVDDPSSPLGSVAERSSTIAHALWTTVAYDLQRMLRSCRSARTRHATRHTLRFLMWALLSACEKSQMVFTYDNDKSYRYKVSVASTWRVCGMASSPLGINMDDTTNKCGQGSYARLRTLRWLVEYFNTSFNSPDDYDRCQRGP
ncbi:hypothetical protein MRX96_056293 [Rhipicephalus microplus]